MQLGERDVHTRPSRTGRSAGFSGPTRTAASSARAASSALESPRAWTIASGRSGPTWAPIGATSERPDAVVDLVVLAAAVAAEAGDDEADGARVDALDVARPLGRDRPADRGRRQLRVLDEVARPAERRHHRAEALGGAAVVEHALHHLARAVVVRRQLRLHEHGGGERDRHLVQPRLAARAGQVVDRLAHLERVAGGGPEDLVHVGDQRHGVLPGAGRDLHQRPRQRLGVLAGGHERARAGLDVEHERVEALGELLGEDAGHDQRDRLDRAGGVADRVQAPVGGRQIGGLADDRAARLAHDALDHLGRGHRLVARDAVELVQRAAGVAEAAAGDHRHRRAARRQHRREHQRHLVADAAGRVLVEHRLVEVPVEHGAGVAHRAGQRDALVGLQPAQEERHRERADLRVGEPAVGDPADQEVDLLGAQRRAVALAADDLRREHESSANRWTRRIRSRAATSALRKRLLVRELLAAHPLGEVRDRRHRGDPQAGVTGQDHLGNRRHPDRVGAERAERADLGRGLEGRSGGRQVDALGEVDPQRVGGRRAAPRAAPGRTRRAGSGSAGRSRRRWGR